MGEKEMDLIADFMARVLVERLSPDTVVQDVVEFRQGYQTLYYNFDHALPPNERVRQCLTRLSKKSKNRRRFRCAHYCAQTGAGQYIEIAQVEAAPPLLVLARLPPPLHTARHAGRTAPMAGCLVLELKAEGEDESTHQFDKGLAVAKELQVGRLVGSITITSGGFVIMRVLKTLTFPLL